MNALSMLAPLPILELLSSSSSPPRFLSCSLTRVLGFCCPKSLTTSSPLRLRFRVAFDYQSSAFPAEHRISDADEDEDEDDDDDDDVAAEEYDDIPGDVSDGIEPSDEEIDLPMAAAEASTRFEEFKWQRVERILKEVRIFGEEIIDADELASIYDFLIDKFQRLAIQAFLEGSSVVVSAPTSSGKTLIAEAAAVATVARKRRLFYTTPLKALSNQKFREFRETFGDTNVGLLTGDSAINKDAQILIMTTEILRNMLYQSIGMMSSGSGLFHVDVIVLDEVHYLSDISRGTVWEEIVIYCPKEVQLICLSATVANPDELAGWIGQIHGMTELVTSSKRPVPLSWHFSTRNSLLPLLDEKGTRMNRYLLRMKKYKYLSKALFLYVLQNFAVVTQDSKMFRYVEVALKSSMFPAPLTNRNRKLSLNYLQLHASGVKSYKEDGYKRRNSRKRESQMSYDDISSITGQQSLSKQDINSIRRSQIPLVTDTLWQLKGGDMLPAIWFIFSRKGCDAAAQYLEGSKLLDECETSEVELALNKFRMQYPDAVRETAIKGLLQGVAAHHAGCLPLWKSFIEELFQRGLVKVVFATETLAAGINMPARTAVISSISKRSNTGRVQLSSNELLQMAGRAGRRGIDGRGHVVLVQTPSEGAEESCKLLFAGMEPLVSQFTASYGMVLNLLSGAKVTRRSNDGNDKKALLAGRTLDEARKLVEKSFGNYVGSNVMLAAKEELTKIKKEIEILTSEITDEAIDRKSRKLMSVESYKEIAELQDELRSQKQLRTELRRKMETRRISALRSLLKECQNGQLPFICMQYKDSEGVEHSVPSLFLGNVGSSELRNIVATNASLPVNMIEEEHIDKDHAIDENVGVKPSYYVALGSDNAWYLFTENWIRAVYKTGFPNVPLAKGDALPREIMRRLLDKEEKKWENLAESAQGSLWCMEGSLETWSWSLNVPVLNSLSENDELLQESPAYLEALNCYKEQRTKVARLKKRIARTEGFKEYKKVIDVTKMIEDKIRQLKARSSRLSNRIEQIEPSGWKEFLHISNVIHEMRALDINTHVIYPLGETAAAIRGENELWLAMVLRSKLLLDLKPAQLAGFVASLVCEGIKLRPWKNNSYIFEPSSAVIKVINILENQRSSLMRIQEKHGVNIPICLDCQFSGMVEAWASGLTWREMMMDCAMDEGDLARLLRRTIDLLGQIPKLPDIDPLLQSNASTASNVMDRPPISELAG